VNLIGEHTDYNDGFVLPAAIDKHVILGLAANGTEQCNIYASSFDEMARFDIECSHRREGWVNHVLGVVYYLRQKGYPVSGFDAVLDSTLPVGAGLSSSAAVEGAVGYGLSCLFGLQTDRTELARIGQLAEHNFAGVKCGIMDLFANMHGKKDKLIRLDCRSLDYEYVPFCFPEYKIVLCNSMVHHSLASSEYNVRRAQCEEGVEAVRRSFKQVKNLRDVTLEMLKQSEQQMSKEVYRRCKYVIEENSRLLKGCRRMEENDLKGFGELMYATHEGLSRDYGVSCHELDTLVSLARKRPEVAGARMMGGGFGGCTINIVEAGRVDDFSTVIRTEYRKTCDRDPEIYVTTIEDGTHSL
jgi:galactokinase